MRIGIDATCWNNRRGYGRFTRGLIHAFLELDNDDEIILFIDIQTANECQLPNNATYVVVPTAQSPAEAASAEGRRSLMDLFAMTLATSRYPLDVFFFPSVYTYFPIANRAKIILGIHDVIAEDFPKLIFPKQKGLLFWRIKGWLARRQADYILTVSNHAKRGIIRHFSCQPEQVLVVDEAPDPVFRPLPSENIDRALLQRYGLSVNDRFFLYLGGINPHKNLDMLITCLAELHNDSSFYDVRLVIIGDIHRDVFTPGLESLEQKIQSIGLVDKVCFTGYLSDKEAIHFFNTAQAVVLPSFAEGFGLPAIEGAACGTAVIATRNSPLPELLIGGGLFIDPQKPSELMHAMRSVLTDESLRRQLEETALKQARQYTWQRTAYQYRELLNRVIG